MSLRHRVVVVGGGFAGLACVRQLKHSSAEIFLIDRLNYHLFQPLLYQVATGELSPANIASPLRAIVRKQKNCTVLMKEVVDFDVKNKKVILSDDTFLTYDTLVLATGSTHSYFGNTEWQKYAPGLKSIEQATEIRRRILYAFEAAEFEEDPVRRKEWLTFSIVGAGPTGVELAGALSEIAHHMLKQDFRRIAPDETQILLIEAGPRPLAMYPEPLCQKAAEQMERLKITLKTGCMVTSITEQNVTVKKDDQLEQIPCRTVIWAAGVAASPLGKKLAEVTGATLDRVGKVLVQPNLSVANYPNIFVLGDLASLKNGNGNPLPGLAPVAMQEGKYVANLIDRRVNKQDTSNDKPFHYKDRGSMAVIGRYKAIAMINNKKLSGFVAWMVWLFVHLMEITQFRNRLLVLMQWGWTYLTHDRAARLITGFKELRKEKLMK